MMPGIEPIIVKSLSAKYRLDRYRRHKSVKFGSQSFLNTCRLILEGVPVTNGPSKKGGGLTFTYNSRLCYLWWVQYFFDLAKKHLFQFFKFLIW